MVAQALVMPGVLRQSPLVTAVTWDPANKLGSWVLSNGNLTAVGTSGPDWIKATLARSSGGPWSYELHLDAESASSPCIGIGDAGAVAGYPGVAVGENAYGYYTASGQKTFNGTGPAYGAIAVVGDYVGVKLDFAVGLTFYLNGVSQGLAFASVAGLFFPMWSSISGANTCTGNFGATAFAFPIAGSTSWDGSRVM